MNFRNLIILALFMMSSFHSYCQVKENLITASLKIGDEKSEWREVFCPEYFQLKKVALAGYTDSYFTLKINAKEPLQTRVRKGQKMSPVFQFNNRSSKNIIKVKLDNAFILDGKIVNVNSVVTEEIVFAYTETAWTIIQNEEIISSGTSAEKLNYLLQRIEDQ